MLHCLFCVALFFRLLSSRSLLCYFLLIFPHCLIVSGFHFGPLCSVLLGFPRNFCLSLALLFFSHCWLVNLFAYLGSEIDKRN